MRWEIILNYTSGPSLITWILKIRAVVLAVIRGRCDKRSERQERAGFEAEGKEPKPRNEDGL